MIDFALEEEEAPKLEFHQTRLGCITQYIDPISNGAGLEDAREMLAANSGIRSLPVEKDGGVIGLIDRDVVYKKCENPFEIIRDRGLESYVEPRGLILDAMESIDRALSQALERKAEHVDRDFLIYHYGKFLGVGSFLSLLKQADFLRNRDLSEAQFAQEHLVELGSAPVSSFEVYPYMKMAHELGGDFHQTMDLGAGNYLVACFDVSGKGVAASLATCIISSFFSTLKISGALAGLDPDKLVVMLGELLGSSLLAGKFVVGAMVFVDTKHRALWIYNLALGPLYVFHTGEGDKALLSVVQPTAAPLGLEDFSAIETKRKVIQIKSPMRLFMYTIGLTDARNPAGQMYGEERVKEFLSSRFRKPAAAVMAELAAQMEGFIGNAPQADDMTAIAIGF